MNRGHGPSGRLVYPTHTRAFEVAAVVIKSILLAVLGFIILFYGPSLYDYFAKRSSQIASPRATTSPLFVIVLMNDEELAKAAANAPNNTKAAHAKVVHGPCVTAIVKGTGEFDKRYVLPRELEEWEKSIARDLIRDGGWKHYTPRDAAAANRHRIVITLTGAGDEFDGYLGRDQELNDWEKEVARFVAELTETGDGN